MTTDDSSPVAYGGPPTIGHAAFRQIADYVDGLLDAPELAATRSEVQQLVQASPEAAATERWLREVRAVATRVPLAPRSPLLEQRLRLYFTRWSHAQNVLTRPVPRFTATIIADSRHDRQLVGVRGSADTVCLVYGCEMGELALDVRAFGADTVSVDGQLLLDTDTASPYFGVRAVGAGLHEQTESDELGRFYFRSLPARSATLRLDNGELEIAASVDLGPLGTGSATT